VKLSKDSSDKEKLAIDAINTRFDSSPS
jgi:hypothetical protein